MYSEIAPNGDDASCSTSVKLIHANPARKTYRRHVINRIPVEILENPVLLAASRDCLPSNYDFELPKTVWRIQQLKARRVAIQLPEGLQMFAIKISDVLVTVTGVDVVILADVTYGACCIDDLSARALGVDLLVHYGHSCLVPIDQPGDDKRERLDFLYVFVNIRIDVDHIVETIRLNFSANDTKLALVSTIQFVTALHNLASTLQQHSYQCLIPQKKPLSPGEILGCTAPTVPNDHVVLYLGDGRFHLEAAMIANPETRYFRYDPYEKKMTEEFYEHERMKELRVVTVEKARTASTVGLILGTLGRQGNINVLKYLQRYLNPERNKYNDYVVVLLSEILPQKLLSFGNSVDAWIQIACPRLSIDWGTTFHKPLLTPYEGIVAFGNSCHSKSFSSNRYPMDYYAEDSLGPWTPRHKNKLCSNVNCNKIDGTSCTS